MTRKKKKTRSLRYNDCWWLWWIQLFLVSFLLIQSSNICCCEAAAEDYHHHHHGGGGGTGVAIHPKTQRGQQELKMLRRREKDNNEHSQSIRRRILLGGGSVPKRTLWKGFHLSDDHRHDNHGVSFEDDDNKSISENTRRRRNLRSGQNARGPRRNNNSSGSTKSGKTRSNNSQPPPPSIWPQHNDKYNQDSDEEPGALSGVECFQRRVLTFLQLSALEGVNTTSSTPVNPVFINYDMPDAQNLGTVYIYNDALFDESSSAELEGSFATGHCIRTQMRESLGDGNFVSGGGYCHFTYTFFDGRNTYSFNAAGEVFDSFGGNLVISGGTDDLVGVTGHVVLQPQEVSEEDGSRFPSSDDVFMDADVYQSTATLHINMCLL